MLRKGRGKNALFKCVKKLDEVAFKKLLKENDPHVKWKGISLLHLIVRNAGPIHLHALIEAGIDINALSEQETHAPASALQWITGMICPETTCFGWPNNYESHGKHALCGDDFYRELDGFVGSANEIMVEISKVLLANGAKIDFYSACALGEQNIVEEFLMNEPNLVLTLGPDGGSALAWAARRNQHAVVALLIEKGALVNQINATSSLMPLEEAILFHGSKETIALLIDKGARARKGIIGRCTNRVESLDFLLSCTDNPTQLVTDQDIQAIQFTTNYEKILNVFSKYGVSLSEIDRNLKKTLMGYPLIFAGCIQNYRMLRLLISMGCDINASFPEKFVWLGKNHENVNLIDAKPLVFLYLDLRRTASKKKKLEILQKMAILFFHGSDIHPIHPTQPHPLKDLHGSDLINFLSFLCDEIELNQDVEIYALSKVSASAMVLLKEKINEASLASSEKDIKNKLEDLVYCCEPPSLMKLCIQSIVKSGLFKNPQELNTPTELKERILRVTNVSRERKVGL